MLEIIEIFVFHTTWFADIILKLILLNQPWPEKNQICGSTRQKWKMNSKSTVGAYVVTKWKKNHG